MSMISDDEWDDETPTDALRETCISRGMPEDFDNDQMQAWLIEQMRGNDPLAVVRSAVMTAATDAANKVAADYEARKQSTGTTDPTIGTPVLGGAVGELGNWTPEQRAELMGDVPPRPHDYRSGL